MADINKLAPEPALSCAPAKSRKKGGLYHRSIFQDSGLVSLEKLLASSTKGTVSEPGKGGIQVVESG